ncbi:hypothetical protein MKZ38_006609 [Zalerion maritima]|uniref:NIMA interactive protein n=1 Tax=Zalerion maritima TaxID=339359 RepID=A0AAD5RJS0_9PEZI|nr:hypothetical protein MKZ38_006609 [Zalerion maritima]
MVQYEHLRTASLYINNQLLSRGLLKDGQTIDFCDPDACEGGAGETTGKIMGVVNDLILRRDRDAEHRESLSTTLRTVRAESLRLTNDVTRLSERQADTQRKLAAAETAETAAKTQLKSAESAIRGLKEEMARARTMVAQTRASCANEVRKRDRQIESLKKHVADAGRTRGVSRSNAITTISVTGEFGGKEKGGVPSGCAMDEDYDLHAETNDFLTELAKGLSVENDALLALVRRTLSNLREMGGMQKEAQEPKAKEEEGNVVTYQSNCEDLSTDLENILEHLRAILSNPSFVPIEEVEVREEEIQRLRDGWDKMETRWKEAVYLIDGWRRRMLSNGKGVNMEELKMGLRLSPVRVRDVAETSQGYGVFPLSAVKEEDEEQVDYANQDMPESPCPRGSLDLVPAPNYDEDEHDDSDSDSSSIFHEDIELEDLETEEPNIEILEQSIVIDSSHYRHPLKPHQSALLESESAANRGSSDRPQERQKPGDFTTIMEENTLEVQEASMPPPPKPTPPEEQPSQARRRRAAPRHIQPPSPPPSNSSTSSTEQAQSRGRAQVQNPQPAQPRSRPQQQRPLPSKPTNDRATRIKARTAQAAQLVSNPKAPAPSQQAQPKSKLQPQPRPSPSPVHAASPEKQPVSAPTSQPASRSASAADITNPDTANNTQSTASTSHTNTLATTIRSTTPDPEDELAMAMAMSNTSSKPATSPERHDAAEPQRVAQTPNPRRDRDFSGGDRTGNERDRSPMRRAGSRLPLPANAPVQPSPQLTMASIAAKLAASEREADAARVRAKLKAVRRPAKGGVKRAPEQNMASAGSDGTNELAATAGGGGLVDEAPVKKRAAAIVNGTVGMGSISSEEGGGVALLSRSGTGAAVDDLSSSERPGQRKKEQINVEKPRKRERRASKVANRRRSTLSPWEMQSLIAGSVVDSPCKEGRD